MHEHRGDDAVPRALQQVPDHGTADAEAHHHEPVDPEMVHQAELVVGEAVPCPLDLERTLRLTAIGVAQVQRDDAIGVAECLQRIEGMVGEPRYGRVQSAAGNDQQREAGTGLLVMDLHGTFFIDWHGGSPFPMRYTAVVQVVSTPLAFDHASQKGAIRRDGPHMVTLIAATAPGTEFAQ